MFFNLGPYFYFIVGFILVILLILTVIKVLGRQNSRADAKNILSKRDSKSSTAVEFPYRKLPTLVTPAERSFLGVLKQAVGEEVDVFSKVRVADVLAPNNGLPRRRWQTAFNKISRKHFDFVLCDPNDLSIRCAVELNDRSHKQGKRAARDTFLENACQAAGLPLVQFPARSTYKVDEIRQDLVAYVGKEVPAAASVPIPAGVEGEKQIQPGEPDKKRCPKCNSVLVERTAKKGPHVGQKFWACSGFPNCRYVERFEG